MGKAIVYVSVSGASALISFLWYAFGREFALLPAIASVLAIGVSLPVLLRKDFQFVGIPGPVEIFFALCSLGAAILGGTRVNPHWFWLAVILQTLPSIRISLVSLKAYQRPKSLKIAVGAGLAALFGMNVVLGIQHSHWLGETSVALVKEWFPDATSPRDRTVEVKAPAPKPKPKPDPAPASPVPPKGEAPVAVIAGRQLTKEMVEYQRYIDGLIDERTDRNDAVAALLQAYATRAILEKKFQAFEPSMLRDERQWLMNRTRDSKIVYKIKHHSTEELFLDVYVGANGFYKRKLQEIFAKRKQEELKSRVAEVLAEVRKADGVERPGPKLDGVRKEECRYSYKKRDFIGKFDAEPEDQENPHPKDELAAKLAKLPVNTAMSEVLWGDMNAVVVRRIPDDFQKRAVYEKYTVIEDALYSVWFKKQCAEFEILIADATLRRDMLGLAKDVTHIIK